MGGTWEHSKPPPSRQDRLWDRQKKTNHSRINGSDDHSRPTFNANPLLITHRHTSRPTKTFTRTYNRSTGRRRSRSPDREPKSFHRDRDVTMHTVTARTQLQTSRHPDSNAVDALSRSINRSRHPLFAGHNIVGHGLDLTSAIHRVKQFVLSLNGKPLSPEDLDTYLTETLGLESRQSIAECWNVISSVVYAPMYDQLCTKDSFAAHFQQNRIEASPGRVGSGPIFSHRLDPTISPSELHRVDTSYGPFLVKWRHFAVHSVEEQEMFVVPVMGFGEGNTLLSNEIVQGQYAYFSPQDSNPAGLIADIPHIHFTTKNTPSKQGHLHVARGVWLPLRLPVSWEGRVVDEDLGVFADAVGTVGQIGPTQLMEMYAKRKQALADEAKRAGYTLEKHKERDAKKARQDIDRKRLLQGD